MENEEQNLDAGQCSTLIPHLSKKFVVCNVKVLLSVCGRTSTGVNHTFAFTATSYRFTLLQPFGQILHLQFHVFVSNNTIAIPADSCTAKLKPPPPPLSHRTHPRPHHRSTGHTMGCAGSTADPAAIEYDTPMETILHTTEKICPPTIVSEVVPSNRVVRVVGRIEAGQKSSPLWSYSSGSQSVFIDLELIVETNYMVSVERDEEEPDFSFMDDMDDDDDEPLDFDLFEKELEKDLENDLDQDLDTNVDTALEQELDTGTTPELNQGADELEEKVADKIVSTPPSSEQNATSDTDHESTTIVDETTSSPSAYERCSHIIATTLIADPLNPLAIAPHSFITQTASIAKTTPTPIPATAATTATTATTLPSPPTHPHPSTLNGTEADNDDNDDDDDNNDDDNDDLFLYEDQEQLHEFVPGFDAWSEGLKERSDFWLVQGGQRIYIPMQSKNYSMLTDLRRDREMYGDPMLIGRKKREHREEDYYLGSNKVVGGCLSKNGASRVDFEAATWIRSSKNSESFPTNLKHKINDDYSDLSNEYFSGASYGFREARLIVGQTVHVLGVVKEEVFQTKKGKRKKILVLHPFKAKKLLAQQPPVLKDPVTRGTTTTNHGRMDSPSPGVISPNPILRSLLQEDFRNVGQRMVLSTKDDDGNSWNVGDYESRTTPGFPPKTNNIMGASKVNEETVLNNRTKIMPAAAASKMEEEEDQTLVKKVIPMISLKLMQAFPVLVEEVPVLDLDQPVVVPRR